MRIEQALVVKLRATPAVAALVSERIYPLKAPQNTKAAHVLYQNVGGKLGMAHDGPDGLSETRMSYTCVAAGYAEAKSISEALRTVLAGFRGTLSGLAVSIHTASDDEDFYDDALGLYQTVVDFELYWSG